MTRARPTQTFLLLIPENDPPEIRAALAEFVETFGRIRNWQCSPPKRVCARGDGADADDTAGCEFEVFSPLPLGSLPRELDRHAFEDVSFVIAEACKFSLRHRVSLELWQRQAGGEELIGEIFDGVPDRAVRIGLIGEWQRVLDDQPS